MRVKFRLRHRCQIVFVDNGEKDKVRILKMKNALSIRFTDEEKAVLRKVILVKYEAFI
jgi:hypothetical protein